jgi:hypothetical protein
MLSARGALTTIRVEINVRASSCPNDILGLNFRMTMLSPHEYSTLMLIKHAASPVDLTRDEVHPLMRRQLIVYDEQKRSMRITALGEHILHALAAMMCEPRRY